MSRKYFPQAQTGATTHTTIQDAREGRASGHTVSSEPKLTCGALTPRRGGEVDGDAPTCEFIIKSFPWSKLSRYRAAAVGKTRARAAHPELRQRSAKLTIQGIDV